MPMGTTLFVGTDVSQAVNRTRFFDGAGVEVALRVAQRPAGVQGPGGPGDGASRHDRRAGDPLGGRGHQPVLVAVEFNNSVTAQAWPDRVTGRPLCAPGRRIRRYSRPLRARATRGGLGSGKLHGRSSPDAHREAPPTLGESAPRSRGFRSDTDGAPMKNRVFEPYTSLSPGPFAQSAHAVGEPRDARRPSPPGSGRVPAPDAGGQRGPGLSARRTGPPRALG